MAGSRHPIATVARLVVALAAGFVILLLLFPYSGIDTDPPECYSVFGYVVPCDGWVAPAAAAGAALLVWLAWSALGRRR